MTAANTIRIVSPIGQRAVERMALARRLDTLNGKSIGFIDNIKPNAGLFIQHIEEMIHADYSGVQTHTVRKNFTSSKLIANELEGKVQALVNAWGD
jgi:predicted metal-dependent phosphoesterase TrpH